MVIYTSRVYIDARVRTYSLPSCRDFVPRTRLRDTEAWPPPSSFVLPKVGAPSGQYATLRFARSPSAPVGLRPPMSAQSVAPP